MITVNEYNNYLRANGKHLGEVRKNQSDMIMNATFTGDIGYRRVYILDPKEGWKFVDAKFAKHSNPTIIKDQVDSYLQFRPKVHFPVGTYVFIPDDTSYELDINFEHPFQGDVSNLWLIVGRSDYKQFVQYLIMRCNWNLKWVVGHGDRKNIYSCIGVHRNANSQVWLAMKEISSNNKPLNCWNPLRALLPQHGDEICMCVMDKKYKDWEISSQASNRGRFNDYDFCQ